MRMWRYFGRVSWSCGLSALVIASFGSHLWFVFTRKERRCDSPQEFVRLTEVMAGPSTEVLGEVDR